MRHTVPPPATIESPRNPAVAAAIALHRRRTRAAESRTLVEGPHLLSDAVNAGAAVETVFARPDDGPAAGLARRAGAELLTVTDRVLDRLAPTEHPRGPVAVVRIPAPVPYDGGDALCLWGVGDPGNAGTIVRTAGAFGLAVVTVPGTVDLWSPKALRAGAGGQFRVALSALAAPDPGLLAAAGAFVAAAVPAGGEPPETLPAGRGVAVLIGDEARGIPATVEERCDRRVTIPLAAGTESLNAAAAAAIIGYVRYRARSG